MTNLFKKLKIKSAMSKILIIGWLTLVGGGLAAFSQSNDLFPIPETYQIEGIPAIKNSEVENLFYDSSAIKSNLIWDTDGVNKRMLVTDETNNIYLLNSPLSLPVKLIDKIVPYSVKINPNGKTFAFTSDSEHKDNYQLYLNDFKEKTPKKLFALTGKDESIDSFIWKRSGDALFYVRVDYESKTSKLCQYNFTLEKCFPVELKGIWDVLQDGESKILLKYWKSSSNQLIYVYYIQSNKLIPIDEKGNSRRAFLVKDRIFWTSEGNENCKTEPCLLSMDLKRNKTTQVKLPIDILSFYDVKISPEGNNLIIQETKDGIDILRVFRLKQDKIIKEIPSFISGSYVIWNTRWLTDKEVVYTLENIGKPASIQSYNINTKKLTDWTKARLPKLLENKVKSPEVIKWKSFDGREIPGYVVRPASRQEKSPVLIFVHGGPQILDRPIFNPEDIRLSSNLGLTIIHTNIRGSLGFGKNFLDADNKEKRGDAVKDIQALLDWIEKQPELDASQIYLRGQSYGGLISLSTALQESNRIKGVIVEYPLVSIRAFLAQSWIDEFAKNEYGDPKDEVLMSKLDSLSPLNNMNRWNKIPVFLTRGNKDTRVPEKEVVELKVQLQNIGSEVWFIKSTNDGHGFSSKYLFAAMYKFLKNQINKEKISEK